jgi:hypothetical protein
MKTTDDYPETSDLHRYCDNCDSVMDADMGPLCGLCLAIAEESETH